MTLAEALGVVDGDVVALVGAGGKTTAMFRLAKELCAEGKKVVVTTTTRILPPTPSQASCSVEAEDGGALLDSVRQALKGACPVVASRGLAPDGKLIAVEPGWVASLQRLADNVLVEADGAAGRPFKAPKDYEPVIPPSATLVVPVVGVEIVGQPLSPETTHRPERIAAIANIHMGELITSEVVAEVMLHPQGNIKGSPKGARVIPLINKVDSQERLALAREIARHLLQRGARKVVLARCADEPPVVEVVVAGGP